jgi:hypothetical protein
MRLVPDQSDLLRTKFVFDQQILWHRHLPYRRPLDAPFQSVNVVANTRVDHLRRVASVPHNFGIGRGKSGEAESTVAIYAEIVPPQSPSLAYGQVW